MAKGYNPNKAKEKQQTRASNVGESNFGENVLENLTREFDVPKVYSQNHIHRLPIIELYAAPNNEDWNDFSKLSHDKAYELNQSIVDGGLLTPIIVWRVNKNTLNDLYRDNEDVYGFIGEEYMILAGHSRTYSYVTLYNQTKDEQYLNIDAIVKENLTYDEARYIIKVTNFVNRELSVKEKRRNVKFMHRTLSANKTKGMNIAKKIADDTGSALRTVQYQIAINEKLIPEFVQMYDDEILSQANILKLTNLNQSLQQWMYDTYKDQINNKVMRNFQKYFDRKELISTIFHEDVIEYITVSVDIPSNKEEQFRKMVKNWLNRNK